MKKSLQKILQQLHDLEVNIEIFIMFDSCFCFRVFEQEICCASAKDLRDHLADVLRQMKDNDVYGIVFKKKWWQL